MSSKNPVLNSFEQGIIKSKFPNTELHFYDYSSETEILCFDLETRKLIGVVSTVDWGNNNKDKLMLEEIVSRIKGYITHYESLSD